MGSDVNFGGAPQPHITIADSDAQSIHYAIQNLPVCAFPHRLPLSYDLGTLAGGLGSFPFHDEPYHPPCVSRDCTSWYSEFAMVW